MALSYKEYKLDNAAVEAISADVQDYLNRLKTERRNVQRIRLTVEELLLNLMGSAYGPEKVGVSIGKRFGRSILRLHYKGAAFDPTGGGDSPWSDDILRSLGYSPAWSYKGRMNTVSLLLTEKHKRSAASLVIFAAVLAIVLGLVGGDLTASFREGVTKAILEPVAGAFIGLLRTFSGLMIAFTICNGILGMGDTATAGRKGVSFIMWFILISFAAGILTAVISLPFLDLNYSAGDQGRIVNAEDISRLIFDILPSNIIEPFQTGNALQIIVIAVITGAGILAVGERGSRIRGVVDDLATILQHILSWICSLVPVFVFCTILQQLWAGKMDALLSVFKPLFITIILSIVLCGGMLLLTAVRLKCPCSLLLKKILPAASIAFTTASSFSALPSCMETCERELGVRKSTTSFICPLATVIFMPASVVFFNETCFAFAEIYRTEVGPAWMIRAVVIATLVVIALPPVPGAAVMGFSIMYGSLGLPAEAIVLATAMDLVLDFLDTGFNIMMMMTQTAHEADRLGELDREKLLHAET